MSTFTNKTGLQLLEFISNLNISYGKNNLSKMIWHAFQGFSVQQAKDLVSQLVEKDYLQELNVGVGFAMVVITLTEKGKVAIQNKEEVLLDFQRFYEEPFKQAADIGIIDKDILEEYYYLKRELVALQKREEELKDTIKKTMTEKKVGELHNEFMDLYCKEIERVSYLKEKIEKFVPQGLLEKIKTINKITVLTTRLKEMHTEK